MRRTLSWVYCQSVRPFSAVPAAPRSPTPMLSCAPARNPPAGGAHGVDDIHGQIIAPHGGTIGAGADELVVQRTFLTARFIEFVIQAAADGGR